MSVDTWIGTVSTELYLSLYPCPVCVWIFSPCLTMFGFLFHVCICFTKTDASIFPTPLLLNIYVTRTKKNLSEAQTLKNKILLVLLRRTNWSKSYICTESKGELSPALEIFGTLSKIVGGPKCLNVTFFSLVYLTPSYPPECLWTPPPPRALTRAYVWSQCDILGGARNDPSGHQGRSLHPASPSSTLFVRSFVSGDASSLPYAQSFLPPPPPTPGPAFDATEAQFFPRGNTLVMMAVQITPKLNALCLST